MEDSKLLFWARNTLHWTQMEVKTLRFTKMEDWALTVNIKSRYCIAAK